MESAKEETPLLNQSSSYTFSNFQNPFASLIAFYRRIIDNFGWSFAMMLASTYIGVKGFLLTVVGIGQVPLYKDYMGLGADRFQSLKTVASTPWATKALMGALSDSLPLFGYHKRSYIFITAVLGTVALIVVATIPKTGPPELAAAMFFLIMLFITVADLLCEGKYAELMRSKPQTGSDLVSWVWGLVMFGTLLGSTVAGPVAEAGHPRTIFWICIPFGLQIIFPLMLGWLPEEYVPKGSRGFRMDKFRQQPRLFILGIFVACGALVLAIVGEIATPLVQVGVSLTVSVAACVLAQLSLPRILANANLYMFLSNILYIQVDGAMTYFFLATPQQLPDGPHFSNIYYFTYTAIVGAVAGIAGVSIFQVFLSKRTFRTAFWTTTTIQCVAAIFDICIVKRWNVHVLGISDSWFYMLGDAMIGGVISMMNFMPSIVLTSKVCPKGLESLVYALLAGFQNFGGTVASYTGAYVIERVGIKTDPKVVPWDFSGLAELLVVAHMILPLLAVPLTFVLIPDANMTDDLQFEDLSIGTDTEEDAKEASGETNPRKVLPANE